MAASSESLSAVSCCSSACSKSSSDTEGPAAVAVGADAPLAEKTGAAEAVVTRLAPLPPCAATENTGVSAFAALGAIFACPKPNPAPATGADDDEVGVMAAENGPGDACGKAGMRRCAPFETGEAADNGTAADDLPEAGFPGLNRMPCGALAAAGGDEAAAAAIVGPLPPFTVKTTGVAP